MGKGKLAAARTTGMTDTQRITPVELVEGYREYERGVRTLLDDLERELVEGNDAAVRERVREFASEHQRAFFAVALALDGNEGFFEQVESSRGADVAAEFETLNKDYDSLVEPFRIVRLETAKERRNPITSIDVRTGYSTDQKVPLVGYTVSSGGVELYEYRGTPQETLQSAGYFIQAANDTLAATLEADRSVDTDELSGLIDRYEKLETELNSLYDHIDELRRNPPGE